MGSVTIGFRAGQCAVACAVGAALSLFAAGGARATEGGSVFATAAGECQPGSDGRGTSKYSTGPVAEGHQDVLVRFTASAGPGTVSPSVGFAGPDVIWGPSGLVEAGGMKGATVSCFGVPIAYAVEYQDLPDVPATYSGRTTRTADCAQVNCTGSAVSWFVKRKGQYVASISLSQGAMEVLVPGPPTRTRTFRVGTRRLGLGVISDRRSYLRLDALDGPQAIWRIRVSRVVKVRCRAFTARRGKARVRFDKRSATGLTCAQGKKALTKWVRKRHQPRSGPKSFKCRVISRVKRTGAVSRRCRRTENGIAETLQFRRRAIHSHRRKK